jgi:hypothetical protein
VAGIDDFLESKLTNLAEIDVICAGGLQVSKLLTESGVYTLR